MANLTPLDIESKTFSKSLSGYSPNEVKSFLREVLVNYEHLYRENIELSDKISLLNDGIQYYKTIEDTLKNALVLAEKTAEETRATARKRAEQIEKEGVLKGESIINDSKNEIYSLNKSREALIKQYDVAKIQVTHFLKAQLEMIEKNELNLFEEIKGVEGKDILDDIELSIHGISSENEK